MEEKTYTVTLADGTVIENLRLNGDNYISETAINAAIFTDNCSPVTIDDGISSEVHDYMELVQISEMGDECWFVLRDIPAEKLAKIRMQSDIEYIAMMTGIEL
jgi:hypothetical protein